LNKQAAFAVVVLCLLSVAFTQNSTDLENHGIVVGYMDRSVKPGDDFYRYANGGWIKQAQLPSDSGYISVGGGSREDQSNDLSRKRTTGLIQEAVKANTSAGSYTRKIADLYRSYMNEAEIETRGLAPLRPRLDRIAGIRDKHDLAQALGESLRVDVDPLNWSFFHTPNLFGLWVAPGFNDPAHYAAYLLQGGLEMPDREYYVSDSDRMRDLRAKYLAHISAVLKLAGFADTESRAQHIMELEHAIAEKHVPFADEQDIQSANNSWKQADFGANAPGLYWAEFFRGAGLGGQKSFIVWQPSAVTGESAIVASTALDTWKDWLAFHLIEAYAAVLPKAIADERFAFFGTILSGKARQLPREQRGVALINNATDESGSSFLEGRGVLGDALGHMYAQRYFPPEMKSQVQAMVVNIVAAYRRRIEALPWMDSATKSEAQTKLNTLYVGIGYPEAWRDYSSYEVKADDIFGNLWRGSLFDYHRAVERLGHSVDRKEWCMYTNPQTVSAAELPLQNAIVFPAALFQPPNFDPEAPAAVNYGAAGAVIGHEISHTFDTEGSAVDSTGRVRNWWKPADLEHFEAATAALVAQYDAYKPFPDLALNGKQTLNENIADLGGLAAAYDAYRASLKGKTDPLQNGFSGDQQFFLAFAQDDASKSADAALRQQAMTDVHSPDEFVVATVRNLDAWYAAFDVKPGQKLYLAPPDRIRIW
jgi:putative endopeptidase